MQYHEGGQQVTSFVVPVGMCLWVGCTMQGEGAGQPIASLHK